MPVRIHALAALLMLVGLPFARPANAAENELKVVIQDHRFLPAEVVAPANAKFKLVIENRDATPEEFESRALNREKVIAGKSTATIVVGPLKPGRYPFVGEYHEDVAKGVIIAQ